MLAHLKDVPKPPFASVLVEPLEGEAFIAHGEVLLAAGDPSAALQAATIAEALLARVFTGHMETAHAKLLRAKACGALQRDGEALDLIDEALRIFGSMGDTLDYNRALLVRAVLLCDMCQWTEAAHTLRAAEKAVSFRRYDRRSAEDLHEAVERCQTFGLPTLEESGRSPLDVTYLLRRHGSASCSIFAAPFH